jgi:TonB-linked SusC/RagA family outer membrane protein
MILCGSQTVNIKGYIKDADNGELLVGATIKIIKVKKGINTDGKGFYSVNVENDSEIKLEFSYIGYKNKQLSFYAHKDTLINQALTKDTVQLAEVTVTRQHNFWGNMENGRNISTIGVKKIELLNSNNASDVLQASMPGVWSTNSSGAPGDHQKVRIRGISTIFGCSDPLYIIDGVAVPIVNLHSLGIADLNTSDIDNVTVLKDAASTALYGYQGANGVVIIETKQKKGNSVSFSTRFGVQQVPKYYDLMGTKQFYATMDSAIVNKILTSKFSSFYPAYSNSLSDDNWQKHIFRDGIVKDYQLSGSTSIGKTSLNLSGNYYTQDGIITNSTYDKYSLSGRVDRSFSDKLSIDINFRGSIQKNRNNLDTYNGNNLIIEGINKSPCYTSTPDSLYRYYDPNYRTYFPSNRNYYDYKLTVFNAKYGVNSTGHPMLNNAESVDSVLQENSYKLLERTGAINLVAKYLITGNLYFNASASASVREKLYSMNVKHYKYTDENNYMKSNEHYILYSSQLNLTYDKYFGQQQLNVVAGYRNYSDNAYWNVDTIQDSNNLQSTWLSNSMAVYSNNASVTRQIQSLALHANYNFKKKYNASVLFNYEQLNINQVINNSMLFPSLALSWDISREIFLNELKWLNQLSLFVNVGKSGNYPINTLAKDYYNNVTYYYFTNGELLNSKAVTQFANHYLKPELVNEYNLGMKVSILDNRVKLNIDYYNKTNNNLTIIRDIPASYGGGKIMLNIGKVTNTGTDLNIEIEPIRTQDFSWYSNFVISANKQLIKNIGNGLDKMEFINTSDLLVPQFEVALNSAVGVIKGYKYIGPWTAEDTKLNDKRFKKSTGSKYLAVDTTSTKLSSADYVTIGKTLPDYTWNWDNQFVFKNFSLDLLWYAVKGVNKFNATRASTYMSGLNSEVEGFVNRGDASLTDSRFYRSSYFVEDASFVRLKRLTFSYQFPKKVFKYADLRMSMSLENFITLTKYKGYDPEASIYTDNSFSDFGVDRGAYPNPKSVFFSININL